MTNNMIFSIQTYEGAKPKPCEQNMAMKAASHRTYMNGKTFNNVMSRINGHTILNEGENPTNKIF